MRGPVFFRFGPFKLDAASGDVFHQGTRIPLSGSPRRILAYMVPREAVSKEAPDLTPQFAC